MYFDDNKFIVDFIVDKASAIEYVYNIAQALGWFDKLNTGIYDSRLLLVNEIFPLLI